MRTFSVLSLFIVMSSTLAPQSVQKGQEPTLKVGQITLAITPESMAPTLIPGDQITIDAFYYRSHVPRSGDLVVLRVPRDQPMPDNVVSVLPMLVKRAVAVGGDVVSLSGKKLLLNGIEVSEPYARYELGDRVAGSGDFGPVRIPTDHLFVLGDNRSHSLDSRSFGAISLSAIVGRPLEIYDSPDKSRIGRAVR